MKKIFKSIVLVVGMACTMPVYAADFDKGMDAYKKGDFKTAFKEWEPLAKHGNEEAQKNLAGMYALGIGVSQNTTTAYMWYILAKDNGNESAQQGMDTLKQQMTPSQIATAQKRASRCHKSNYKDCN